MIDVADVLKQALLLPLNDREALANAIIRSIPAAPSMFLTQQQVADELNERIERVARGEQELIPMEESLRRIKLAAEAAA